MPQEHKVGRHWKDAQIGGYQNMPAGYMSIVAADTERDCR